MSLPSAVEQPEVFDAAIDDDDGDAGYGTLPEPRRVIWTMTYQDGRQEEIFEEERALAALLMSESVFLNDHWWAKEWPEEARNLTSINANCNDIFMWGCADAEEIPYRELRSVYDHWVKDPREGVSVWCMKQRKQMPQRPVDKAIRAAAIWDLDAIQKEFGLRANHYDGVSGVLAHRKRSAYQAWMVVLGREPLPFDGKWWAGWKEYTSAHPDWNSAEWKKEDEAAIGEWKAANGYCESIAP